MSRRVRVSAQTDVGRVSPHGGLLRLPREVTEVVLGHLRVHDWGSLRLVCTQLCHTVDASPHWRNTWVSLQYAPDSGSPMWDLLHTRRIGLLDLSHIDRQVDTVGKVLEALPKLRAVCVNSRILYFLGCFHMDSLLECVTTLEVTDSGTARSDFTLNTNWVPLVAATLPNITTLVIHNLRTQIAEFVEKITSLEKLEVLDLELAGSLSTRCAVDIKDFSKLLYMHPNLTDLRIHQMALMSTRILPLMSTPFDPQTCPLDVGDRVLQLRSLDLQLIGNEALNGSGDYALLRTSDLRFMPHLRRLRYTMTGTQLSRVPDYAVQMEDWNLQRADPTATRPRLEHLHLELLRGISGGEWDISVLENLPKSLQYVSVCGEFASGVVAAVGVGLGATLTQLKVHLSTGLTDHQLRHISKTFRVLRYLTASLCDDIKPASILTLGDIASFRRLTLMSDVPDTTIDTTRAAMTREFLIQPYLD